MCCNSWGRKESDTTERLNWTESKKILQVSPKQSYHLLTVKLDVLCVLSCSCPTLWPHGLNSPPGSSICGDSPGKNTGRWVAMPSSRESSQPRCQTWVSCAAGGFFTVWANGEAQFFSSVMSNLWKVKSLLPFGIYVILSFVLFCFFFFSWSDGGIIRIGAS